MLYQGDTAGAVAVIGSAKKHNKNGRAFAYMSPLFTYFLCAPCACNVRQESKQGDGMPTPNILCTPVRIMLKK